MSQSSLTEKEHQYLLSLARETIKERNKDKVLQSVKNEDLSQALKTKRGCFVTLNLNGHLRGCIGYIMPIEPLYKAVIDNAYNAAFHDPRFNAVSKEETDQLHLEISILTVPEPLQFDGEDDLLNKITPLKDGLIIRKGFRSATFLPQVWEQLMNKQDFLSQLCLKAGLKPNEWATGYVEIDTYHAEIIEE